jgi:hypothetical protein
MAFFLNPLVVYVLVISFLFFNVYCVVAILLELNGYE